MRQILLTLFMLFHAGTVFADDREELSLLLDEFLQGASVNDPRMHDRFWSDDLIYTSSSGTRFGKAEIMEGLRAAGQDEEQARSPSRYWAEERQIRLYGDTAVLAFRLEAESPQEGSPKPERLSYFNTGTFEKQDGQWRAVAWQATRIPPQQE